ncbi:AAA family ATPase [Clostridium botulinum]|uniref:AAA family ATPase n=1 Tax=Clostridium botulinum TaxID=1491 RepID=UPI001C9A93B2|nr:AAA family ATPase [Clostridium botulinum]MBY6838218.1 AAA family ATPase [Clostridium botulinum]
MELIYAWIEKYRNIEKCGFKLSNDFTVEVENIHGENCDSVYNCIKKINIKRNTKNLNIYGNNMVNVTAIVGKNSVGKSNFLSCIGELLTSFNDSSFILVYYDEVADNYLLECNKISIKDDYGNIKEAIHCKFQPSTLVLKYDKGKFTEVLNEHELLYDIEYIMIKETLNKMMHPYANCEYSSIPRFGLEYKNSGVLYPFLYLKDIRNGENFKNNDILINFEILNDFNKWDEYEIEFLPKSFLDEKFYYDHDCDKERYVYKKAYMLRFFETTLNRMPFPKDDSTKAQREILKSVVNQCQGDIDKILENYEIIKEKIIEIRTILMINHKENNIDVDVCYKQFVEILEKIIMKVEDKNFLNTFKFSISISSILNDTILSQYVYEFLELADSSKDVSLEFINTKIEIYYDNLSDGLKERFNLFSTIYKCFKQNNIEKFKNLILILDEPDVHMHPEWSRRLFTDILDFLETQFRESKFQIIFTTHSPFMLSDIPKEDILYLSKDDNGELYVDNAVINTFGSNIHMLLKHSFFMDSTIGEFANKRIKDVAKDLSGDIKKVSKDRKKEIRYIINNIGEPVIKRKLEDMYSKKFEHTEINNKIEELSNKVRELEKIIKEKGLE